MSFAVSGLTTGLDVKSMVSQLMQVERLQGNGLYTGQKTSQSFVSTMTTLNGQMKALGDAAAAFAPTSVLDASAFKQVSATSSDESMAKATAGANAAPGSLTFSVKSVAQAGSVISANALSGDKSVSESDFSFEVEANGNRHTVDVKAGSKLADVVAAINQKAGADVQASMVQVASGTYKLQVQSTATGAQSNVNVTDLSTPPVVADVLGSFKQLAEGKDTELVVGAGSAGEFTITSSTREVKDALPGVTIAPVSADPTKTVTIDLKTNVDDLAAKVAAMVKASNDAMSTVNNNSKWDAAKKTGGPFVGESSTRALVGQIQGAFVGSSAYLPSMAGIEIQKDGTVTFDKAKFTAAYTENPSKVADSVTGLATKLGEVSKNASNSTDGSLTLRIQGEQDQLKDYSASIARFEDRMTARQELYQRQYSALDTMLSKLQSQGSWLQGQLASLPNA